MIIRNPKKKCIAKRCEDCHFFQHWNMEDDKGKKSVHEVCAIGVLCDEIPRLRGSVDGCQRATNKTYNKVDRFGNDAVEALQIISQQPKKIEG